MSFFDKAKEAASKAKDVTKGAANKVKDVAKNYTDDLKQQEAKNKEIASAPMEERIKMRPDGVKYCIVNNTGKILDVYDNSEQAWLYCITKWQRLRWGQA